MKILVVSGGRGSVSLQKGLFEITGKNCDNLINMYDDGDSTGKTKRVCRTLAPPDVRKNHSVKYELIGKVNPTIANFYQKRFDLSGNLADFLNSELEKIDDENFKEACISGVQEYLSCDYNFVEYNDFALPNIVYTGLFRKYGVKETDAIISRILSLHSQLYINSLDVLRICGLTESGMLLPNEYELSNYNSDDRIKELFFLDIYDRKVIPKLDKDAEIAILSADIIILSPGTQWSSLVPTYATNGFKNALEKSRAKKYAVINASDDGDTKGYSAQDFHNLICRFLPIKNLKFVSHIHLQSNNPLIVNKEMIEGKKHIPAQLASTIMNDFKQN